MTYEKRIEIIPAYDRRSEGYGIHNAEIRFILLGPEGAIQFVASTGWDLPTVASRSKAWGTDIGYHSYTPRYDGQSVITGSCWILGGKPCYYDGSALNAEPIFNRMVAEGHDAVWEELEKWYKIYLRNEALS